MIAIMIVTICLLIFMVAVSITRSGKKADEVTERMQQRKAEIERTKELKTLQSEKRKGVEETTFVSEKLASYMKVSKEFIQDLSLKAGQQDLDWVQETLTMQLEAHILTRLESVQTVTRLQKRPTFWQWLTRKPIYLTVTVECKELFKNPPPRKEGNEYIYIIAEL